jgi:hypothetical protein
MIISHDIKNIIILRNPNTIPYIESIHSLEIDYIETYLNTYSIFMKEAEDYFVSQSNPNHDQIFYLQFDGASSFEVSGVRVMLNCLLGRPHQFSF